MLFFNHTWNILGKLIQMTSIFLIGKSHQTNVHTNTKLLPPWKTDVAPNFGCHVCFVINTNIP